MAYVIGSQKGKDIAETMKAGESWTNPADGSKWTKNNDGSVSVKTSDGQTHNNAYTSGGGGNSQYTQGNYSIGSDYGKQQAQNLGVGAELIATDGSRWVKENDGTITAYHGGTQTKNAWTPSDLGIAGRQLVEAGVPYQYVQNMLDTRVNKALKDDSLRQYAYDDTYWMMYNYIQDQKKQGNQQEAQDLFNQWMQNYIQENQKPTEPQSDPRIDALLNEILNRDDFSYDAKNDPLYQQYADMYQREGDRAMRNTLAEAAASAGGMNTYAMTAAMQANNYYNSQLTDKIPELYQLAYNTYLNDKESKVQDLGLLQQMDNTQYNRYRDTMNDWYKDKDFAYGMYYDALQQGNWQTQQDYNAMWDKINFNEENYWENKTWNENMSDKNYERDQTTKETEKATADARVEACIGDGVMPSDEWIEQSGWDKAVVLERVNAVRRQLGLLPIGSASSAVTYNVGSSSGGSSKSGGNSGGSSKSGGSSGGSSSSGGSGSSGTATTKTTTTTTTPDWKKGLTDLGLGLVYDSSLITDLRLANAIYEDNGTLKWANGWNANNFRAKLNEKPNTWWG